MVLQNNFFLALQKFYKIGHIVHCIITKCFIKLKMGVTRRFLKLKAFKARISAILNCQCYHRNSEDDTFVTNFKMFDCCRMYGAHISVPRKH